MGALAMNFTATTAIAPDCPFPVWVDLFRKACDIACENRPSDDQTVFYYERAYTPKDALDKIIERDMEGN